MARARFVLETGRLRSNIESLPGRIDGAISAVVDYHAVLGEAKMKSDAPWTDRTGAARVGLHTNSSNEGSKHTIVFAHSVPYGIWLEIKNSGKYEVIMPTVRHTGYLLMYRLNGLMQELR